MYKYLSKYTYINICNINHSLKQTDSLATYNNILESFDYSHSRKIRKNTQIRTLAIINIVNKSDILILLLGFYTQHSQFLNSTVLLAIQIIHNIIINIQDSVDNECQCRPHML